MEEAERTAERIENRSYRKTMMLLKLWWWVKATKTIIRIKVAVVKTVNLQNAACCG